MGSKQAYLLVLAYLFDHSSSAFKQTLESRSRRRAAKHKSGFFLKKKKSEIWFWTFSGVRRAVAFANIVVISLLPSNTCYVHG